TYYKWQRSTDGGTTWTDIAGATGVGAPVWNGSTWQYVTSYTLTPPFTQLANNGNKYRVVVGTTAANMLNTNCNFTDGVAIITLNVIDCTPVLGVNLLSFGGKLQGGRALLDWSTSKEAEPVSFEVERSFDGLNYYRIALFSGVNDPSKNSNPYSFADTTLLAGKTFYRIAVNTASGRRVQSHTIQLQGTAETFALQNVINPFRNVISFDIETSGSGKLEAAILDTHGRKVKDKSFAVNAGISNLVLENTGDLLPGIYILQLQYRDKIITRKLVKK
ncbi:MAG: T9SS type A sorting domain-containing protein, partial [Chitinophagaceae bacterium]